MQEHGSISNNIFMTYHGAKSGEVKAGNGIIRKSKSSARGASIRDVLQQESCVNII